MRPEERLIEFEAMLHASVQRVGRAVRNLRQEMGGYASATPGNGSPGGGKGGRPTVEVDIPAGEPYRLPQHPEDRQRWADEKVAPSGVDHVPVTSVESLALFAGRDDAGEALAELEHAAHAAAELFARMLHRAGRDPVDFDSPRPTVYRVVVLASARLQRLLDVPLSSLRGRAVSDQVVHDDLVDLDRHVETIFRICQRWGYDRHREEMPKDRAEMLAVDLTGMWCTSHLRIGERRPRHRGELCQWCGKFEALEGFIPPRDLVRIHVEFRRVRDDQIRPHRQAHQDRRRAKVKR